MTHSTTAGHAGKDARPPKGSPYKGFPLSPHATGQWCKKIRGKLRYFGKWGKRVRGRWERLPGDGWEAALKLYKAQAADLHAGRTPRLSQDDGSLTVMHLLNRFLTAKQRQLEAKELTVIAFAEYKRTADLVVVQFGKQRLVADLASDDFEQLRSTMAARWGPVRLGNEVQKVRTIFKYAYDNGLIEKPARFGSAFKKPSALVLRRHRAKSNLKMFEAAEIRHMLDVAPAHLRAMVLLGVNCGFGPGDCATLPLDALDLEGGFVDYPRPKTGIERRCPLWAETVEALRVAIAARPEPQKGYGEFAFLTGGGRPWLSQGVANPISRAMRTFTKAAGVYRKSVGFYTLRHVFRTVADATRDPVAIDLIMGHSDRSMGATYRERIDDGRLQAVVEHVHKWLYGKGNSPEEKKAINSRASKDDPATPELKDEGHDDAPKLRLFAG